MVKALKRLKPGQAGTKRAPILLKPNQVLVKFPTAQECFDYQECVSFEVDANYITFTYENEYDEEHLLIPFTALGEEVILNKNDFGEYYENDHNIRIGRSYVNYFHSLVKFIKGEQIDQPLYIDGDVLMYDEKNKEFNVGCKTIDHELANKIFHFVGKKLGYEITE